MGDRHFNNVTILKLIKKKKKKKEKKRKPVLDVLGK
jgi:hypothetical protein